MRYVRAACERDVEELLYRDYVAESLRLRGENKYLTRSWHEMITPRSVDTRSGDEIALDVIKRCGLSLKGGETE